MTNKEAADELQYAINLIKQDGKDWLDERDIPILEAAISALQAQEAKTQLSAKGTTFDLISRQDAIDVLGVFTQADALGNTPKQIVEALPSAQPKIEERKEESAQNVPKEDLISRNAAIDAECEVCQIAPKKERGHNCTYYVHGCKEIECLRALPSAQPEWNEMIVICDCCGHAIRVERRTDETD